MHVDPATGEESLGHPLDAADGRRRRWREWCDTWWPLSAASPAPAPRSGPPATRAWADVVGRVSRGLAVAVDYGHTRDARPPFGSLRSYRDGREVDLLPDGSRDVTAHVAVDSVADRVGGVVLRQREALHRLGVSGARPDLELATSDPAGYVAALARRPRPPSSPPRAGSATSTGSSPPSATSRTRSRAERQEPTPRQHQVHRAADVVAGACARAGQCALLLQEGPSLPAAGAGAHPHRSRRAVDVHVGEAAAGAAAAPG